MRLRLRLLSLFLWTGILSSLLNVAIYGQTVPNVASGIRMPAAIEATADNKTVLVAPTFDDPSKVTALKFLVIGTGKTQPSVKVNPLSVEVSTPRTIDEVIIVYAYGTVQGLSGPVLSDPVGTVIVLRGAEPIPPPNGGGGNPPPPPPPPPPANVDQVFASVKNIHAVLVVDVPSTNREVAILTQMESQFKKHFQQPGTNNQFKQYDIRANELRTQGISAWLIDKTGNVIVPLPCLVMVDGNTNPMPIIGKPTPIQLTGDAVKTANNILNMMAAALSK